MSENQDFDFKPGAESKPIAVYRYENEAGDLVFEKERYVPKAFRFRRRANGRVIYNLRGVEPVPYRLPKWKDGSSVLICEGEKDADATAELGLSSTTGPFGATSWPVELTYWFKDKQVFICYDIGEEKAAEYVAASLYGTAREIRICRLPLTEYEADVTDYINQVPPSDHQRAQQIKLVQDLLKNAGLYQPPEVVTDNPTVLSEAEGEAIEERAAIMEVDGGLSRPEAEEEARKDTHSREATPNRSLDIKNDFLNMWTDSISRVTDAPKVFILFSGIGLLSGILNKMWFSYPRRTNLNLYLLLLAPSTICRKSVVLDIANDYLSDIDPEIVLPESFTPEALLEYLSQNPCGLIIWRELIQVGGFAFGSDYNKALPSLLTDFFDFKPRFKRITKGEKPFEIKFPSISILAAGIQSWLISMMTGRENEFYGGLWTRFLMVSAPDEPRKAFRLPSRMVLMPQVLKRLRDLREVEPKELSLEPIHPLLEFWGKAHQEEALKIERPEMQACFMRFEVALLKIAGILQLADHAESTTIEPQAFSEAVKIIDFLKAQLPVFFEEHVHFSEFDKAKAAVLRLLKKRGRLLKGEITNLAHLRSKFADEVLGQLRVEGAVHPVHVPSSEKGGRPGEAFEYIGRAK